MPGDHIRDKKRAERQLKKDPDYFRNLAKKSWENRKGRKTGLTDVTSEQQREYSKLGVEARKRRK